MAPPDVVYFLKADLPLDGEELKYSLRSLTNFPHSKVWMVTPILPDFVDPAKVILVDYLPQREGKYEDLSEKWKWLGSNRDMPRKVVYFDDDYFVVKKVPHPPDRPWNFEVRDHIGLYTEKGRSMGETKDGVVLTVLKNTLRLLTEHKATTWHPSQHLPWLVRRKNIPLDWEDGNGPYDWKILEFNHRNHNPPRTIHENKSHSIGSTRQVLSRGWPYISSDEKYWETSGLPVWFEKIFDTPSVYERN